MDCNYTFPIGSGNSVYMHYIRINSHNNNNAIPFIIYINGIAFTNRKNAIKLSYARREAPRIFSCNARKYSEASLRCTGWIISSVCPSVCSSVCPSVCHFVCLNSVAQFCVRLYERNIKASDLPFAEKCMH